MDGDEWIGGDCAAANEWAEWGGNGVVENLCGTWYYGQYWCDATAAETLRLCTRHRPRPPPLSVRFEAAPAVLPRAASAATKFEVTDEDSLLAAFRLLQSNLTDGGRLPLVLNMANAGKCGGGFLNATDGQEEELCRRSTLFCELAEAQYPLPPRGGLLTPDVVVIRGPGPGYAELEQPFRIAVATAAAPRFPDTSSEASAREYEALMSAKIDCLLRVCAAAGYQRLVLSAWGCGAFRNPPDVVARLFRAAFGRAPLAAAFEHVVFAVHDRGWRRRPERNRPEFERAFADLVGASRVLPRFAEH